MAEIFRLGGANPPEPEVFERVLTLLVDQDDRLYVLHRSHGAVAVFSAEGEFLHWIRGGRGSGPGEFTTPVRMGFVGDTLWIRNMSPARISRFGLTGTHLGTEAVQLPSPYPSMFGSQGVSGYLIGDRGWVEPDGYPVAAQEGLHPVAALELGPRSADPAPRDTIVTWRSNRGRLRGLYHEPIPEPPFFGIAPDGSGIGVAEWTDDDPASLILRLVAPDGTEQWRQELAVHAPTIAQTELDSLVEDARGQVRRLREALLAQGLPPGGAPDVPTVTETRSMLYLPEHRPPIRRLRVGTDGTFWLELSDDADGVAWLGFDPVSGPLLSVTLPPGAVFGHANRTSVWYSEVDELGVPWVVRARFTQTDP